MQRGGHGGRHDGGHRNSISIRRVSVAGDQAGGTTAGGLIAIKPGRSVVARLDWAELCPANIRICGAPHENFVSGAQAAASRAKKPRNTGDFCRKNFYLGPRRRRNAVTNRGPIRQASGSTPTNRWVEEASGVPKWGEGRGARAKAVCEKWMSRDFTVRGEKRSAFL